MLQYRFVRVDPNIKFVTKLACLQHDTCVSVMEKVEAAIDPYSVFEYLLVFLGIYRPVATSWNQLFHIAMLNPRRRSCF